MAETELEFVERMRRYPPRLWSLEEHDRMNALACRGAAVQWRPISEAPKDGTKVLLWNGFINIGWWTGSRWMWAAEIFHCTNWMPLPPPPESKP